MDEEDERYLWHICYHEAGHAVIADSYGLKISEVRVSAREGRTFLGEAVVEVGAVKIELYSKDEDTMLISRLAGIGAEFIKFNEFEINGAAASDLVWVLGRLNARRDGVKDKNEFHLPIDHKDPMVVWKDLNRKSNFRRMLQHAVSILRDNWSTVTEIAERLYGEEQLTGEDVSSIVGDMKKS